MKKSKSLEGQAIESHHQQKSSGSNLKTEHILLGIAAVGSIGYFMLHKNNVGAPKNNLVVSAEQTPIPAARPSVILSFRPPAHDLTRFAPFRIQVLNNRKNRTEAQLKELANDISEIYQGAKIWLMDDINVFKQAIQNFLDLEEKMTSLEAFSEIYVNLKMTLTNTTKANITWRYGLDGVSPTLAGILR